MNVSVGIHSICGASGTGKTSLLLGIVDLLNPNGGLQSCGTVQLNGVCRTRYATLEFRRRVCLLPQHPVMFTGSILDNLFLAAVSHGLVNKNQRLEHSQTWLQRVGLWSELKDRLHDKAFKLSLGQQQRLALARALVIQPDFLLLDEPTASLDKGNSSAIEDHLLDLSQEKGFVLVSHNQEQVRRLSKSCIDLVPAKAQSAISHHFVSQTLLKCEPQ
jgi:phosphate transport system ATP-binding protein